MLIDNCLYFSESTQVNIRLITQSILKIQKYIYQEAKKYNRENIYKWQKKILLKKEIILTLLFNMIQILKKKLP